MILQVAQQAPGPHAYTQRYIDTFRGITSLHHSLYSGCKRCLINWLDMSTHMAVAE